MTQERLGRINLWKWAFLLLLACNLGLGLVLAGRLLERREEDLVIQQAADGLDLQLGTFTTNREQLNQTLATYLEDYQSKEFSYQVLVGNQTILFEGAYKFLGYQVPLYLYLTPYPLEDGTLRLSVDAFSVGTLPLPAKEVLQYIKSSYDLPDFVTVQPKKETIHIDLRAIDNKEKIYVKADTIDLLNDRIVFSILKKK